SALGLGARFASQRSQRRHAEDIRASPQELPARFVPHPVLRRRMQRVYALLRPVRRKPLCLTLFEVYHPLPPYDPVSLVGSVILIRIPRRPCTRNRTRSPDHNSQGTVPRRMRAPRGIVLSE